MVMTVSGHHYVVHFIRANIDISMKEHNGIMFGLPRVQQPLLLTFSLNICIIINQ